MTPIQKDLKIDAEGSRPATARQWLSIFLCGFAATAGMTLLLLPIARSSNLPIFDVASLLSGLVFRMDGQPYATSWWWAMLGHFINGTVLFPAIYAYFLLPHLPGKSFGKGMVWGGALWLFFQVVLMPLADYGFFSLKFAYPSYALFLTFNAHIIYGFLLGGLVGRVSSSKPRHYYRKGDLTYAHIFVGR